MFEPVIKWSGSKRSQAETILEFFPKEINTYYEPFCGGASVLRRLLTSDIKVQHYICSDINNDLIQLWHEIIYRPELVSLHYEKLWNELNKNDDKKRKKEYFQFIRNRYNTEHNPLDFMFIMRTTTNGMPRYNSKGKFNNSFHSSRNGILPSSLKKIIYEWSDLLNKNDVKFITSSYECISPNKNDFLYLDPPYANTKGMYYGCIDYDKFWTWLREIPCKYLLSFDGISGDCNKTQNVPKDIFSKHEYIINGNSSFKRVLGNSNDSIVKESLYIK